MKRKISIAALGLLLLLYVKVSCAEYSMMMDAMLPIGYDNVGYGNMFSSPGFGAGVSKAIYIQQGYQKIDLRADISYLNWHDKKDYVDWSYTRIPLFLGLRFFMIPNWPVFYVEGGLERTSVKSHYFYTGPLYGKSTSGFSNSHSGSDSGIVPGLGMEFEINKNILFGINARAHLAHDMYGTFYLSVGYKF